jgi:uncharacterized membrane protein (UPF0127 family)
VTARPGGTFRAAALGLLVGAGLVLAGCSSGGGATASGPGSSSAPWTAGAVAPGADGSTAAPEGFAAAVLVVARPDGTTEEHCVWLADTPALRARGLMGVTDPELGGGQAMVFRFPDDVSTGFWMKDTVLPLSIAWYGADGAFVSSADMDPCPADGECPSHHAEGPYRYAVEVARGRLGELGLVEGSTVSLGEGCTPPSP